LDKEVVMPTFGEYLKELRIRQKLSLRDVSDKTGMSYSYLAQIENGKRNPPGHELMNKLATVYHVAVAELLKKAGYLEDPGTDCGLSNEQEVDMAFNYVLSDPRYQSGTRLSGELTTEVKRFIVEMYEKATGKKLLP
jgi:transcriptional regulator with XRE-family HTH domain